MATYTHLLHTVSMHALCPNATTHYRRQHWSGTLSALTHIQLRVSGPTAGASVRASARGPERGGPRSRTGGQQPERWGQSRPGWQSPVPPAQQTGVGTGAISQSFTPRLYYMYTYIHTYVHACLISRRPNIHMPHGETAGGSRTDASTHPTCPTHLSHPFALPCSTHLPRPAPPTCTRDMAAKAFTAIRARPGSPTDQARPHVPTIDEAVSTPWGGRGLLGN